MQRDAHRRHRINRVMNFARTSDVQSLTLENLADVACLSRYHFSRVFAEQCQETPMEFVTRLRLEQSVSNLILRPNMSVTAAALEAGFSSSQSFCNAFTRRFGISPRNFRTKNCWYVNEFPRNQFVLSPEMSKLPVLSPDPSPQWRVVLKTLPVTRLAYVRHRGAYYHWSTGRQTVLATLIEWAKRQGLWWGTNEVIGVCPDHPAVTPPQFCQYDYGIAVEDGVVEDDTVSLQTLPETTLATVAVKSSTTMARQAWRWLISQWLPRSGMIMAGHTYYEIREPSAAALEDENLRILLCLPVTTDPSLVKDRLGKKSPISLN